MTEIRRAKTLPGSSAYEDSEPLALAPDAATVTLGATYTLSTASGVTGAGFPRLRPYFKVNGRWRRDVQVSALTASAEYVRASVRALELDLPAPPVDVLDLAVRMVVPDGASEFKCAAAEIGDAAHAGSLALDVAVGRRV